MEVTDTTTSKAAAQLLISVVDYATANGLNADELLAGFATVQEAALEHHRQQLERMSAKEREMVRAMNAQALAGRIERHRKLGIPTLLSE